MNKASSPVAKTCILTPPQHPIVSPRLWIFRKSFPARAIKIPRPPFPRSRHNENFWFWKNIPWRCAYRSSRMLRRTERVRQVGIRVFALGRRSYNWLGDSFVSEKSLYSGLLRHRWSRSARHVYCSRYRPDSGWSSRKYPASCGRRSTHSSLPEVYYVVMCNCVLMPMPGHHSMQGRSPGRSCGSRWYIRYPGDWEWPLFPGESLHRKGVLQTNDDKWYSPIFWGSERVDDCICFPDHFGSSK